MKRLYLDIGSTNIKSMVSREGESGEVRRTPFPAPAVADGFLYEVEAEEILARVIPIVRGSACDEVYISTQMHGYLLADDKRNLLTRYISWQDKRAEKFGVGIAVGAESGTAMKPNLPRAGVETIRRLQPGLYERAAEFFTLGSYLAFVLTGNNATHITDAAASGYYNVKERSAAICDLKLPQALYEVCPVGMCGRSAVYAPMGDQQCAVLGAGGDENTLILNLGTAAQMCAIADGFASGNFESRPYFNGKTLCTVTGLSGGKRLNTLGSDARAVFALADEYKAAMRRLPQKKNFLVTGGAYSYHRALLERALGIAGADYTVNEGADALAGLKILSEVANG